MRVLRANANAKTQSNSILFDSFCAPKILAPSGSQAIQRTPKSSYRHTSSHINNHCCISLSIQLAESKTLQTTWPSFHWLVSQYKKLPAIDNGLRHNQTRRHIRKVYKKYHFPFSSKCSNNRIHLSSSLTTFIYETIWSVYFHHHHQLFFFFFGLLFLPHSFYQPPHSRVVLPGLWNVYW